VDEHDDQDEQFRPPRQQAEGVRIIGAEEAQAALDAGQVAGRRPEDAPRYGDVPPAPQGPRPGYRFPLPESVDPASVPRPRPQQQEPRRPQQEQQQIDLSPPEEGLQVGGTGQHDLPHWTEPPTGEVPKILGGDDVEDDDDLAAWASLNKSRAPRWRDSNADWEDEGDLADLAGDEAPVGALDMNRTEHSDLYAFDDPEPAPLPDDEPPVAPIRTRVRREAPRREKPARGGGGGRDMGTAVITGLAIFAAYILVSYLGPAFVLVFATAIITACAMELFNVMRRAGYLPASLLGLVATVSLLLATYWKGEAALPLVLVVTVISTLLWYLMGIIPARPTINAAVTLFGIGWVGLLGSFAALLLRDHGLPNGVGLFAGAVLATVAYDVVGYVAGSRIGSRPLAPSISPNKTWEGLLAGGLAAISVSAVITAQIHPWNFKHGLLLGIVVAVVAPVGDLCESMVKRDIGVKDMGDVLPGHGGLLDRFDALLFVLPAVYYLAQYFRIG
jgi:phosphatidate cytidylyltransferase